MVRLIFVCLYWPINLTPTTEESFMGFRKIKYFPPSKLCQIFTWWAWRVSCSIERVFKKIVFLQREKCVRNCQIPSISPRLTVCTVSVCRGVRGYLNILAVVIQNLEVKIKIRGGEQHARVILVIPHIIIMNNIIQFLVILLARKVSILWLLSLTEWGDRIFQSIIVRGKNLQ